VGELAGAAAESPAAAAAMAVVLFALGVKAAVVPVHGWLARTYPFLSPTVTALFSGLHTKVAIYAIYRLYAVVFEGRADLLWVGLVVFSATMVVGVLGALGERDARAVLTFHMVSQIGYVLLGLALFGPLGLAAGIFYLLHNMIVKASLFLSTGAVELVHGRHELGAVTGLLRRDPLTGLVFLAAAVSLAGLPPFSGFVAKLLMILAAIDAGQFLVAGIAVVVSLFTLLSMMKIWGATFLGEPDDTADDLRDEQGHVRRVPVHLVAPAGVLALLSLGLGLGGEVLISLTRTAASGLVDTSTYLTAMGVS
jgi:multicomponent Na+:H+ antiporter subunit D